MKWKLGNSMNNNIDIKTLEAFQDGNHKAFETIFITYYNKTKAFINGYIKSEPDAEELTEDLFVNLWINRHSIDTSNHSILICIPLLEMQP